MTTWHNSNIKTRKADDMTQAIETATDKQIDYLQSLMAQRDVDRAMDVAFIDDAIATHTLAKSAASEYIQDALRCPLRALRNPNVVIDAHIQQDGMYRTPSGEIYKVQRAVHGTGRLYAKHLVVDGFGKAHFEYAAGIVYKLRAEHRMTMEQAKEFGALYGTCCVCGRTLTLEASIEAGIGPVCAGKL